MPSVPDRGEASVPSAQPCSEASEPCARSRSEASVACARGAASGSPLRLLRRNRRPCATVYEQPAGEARRTSQAPHSLARRASQACVCAACARRMRVSQGSETMSCKHPHTQPVVCVVILSLSTNSIVCVAQYSKCGSVYSMQKRAQYSAKGPSTSCYPRGARSMRCACEAALSLARRVARGLHTAAAGRHGGGIQDS